MDNLLPYIGPAFLVAVGYMDPGNWATLIEGGSRFGYELVWVVLFSTFLAMLLQTVSGRLGVITGKHYAQVCREEFPWAVCVLLWVICEISVLTLDLTMVLGTAIGLNVVLQMPTLSSLFLVAVDSLLFIVVLPLLDRKRAVVIAMAVVGTVLLCFLLDTIFSSRLPFSMVMGLSPKLRHETLYTTMSIVGANVMPHNFYLHSALVKDQGQGKQPLSTLFHYNLLSNLFAFSAVLVVNVAVLIVSVAGFHNAGLVVLTLQDAQALIEQVLNNSISPAVFGLALMCAGQLSTMNGSTAGQLVSETIVDYKIHPWQHRVWTRGLALVPAAICVWRYGNEGTFQMLVFSQVILALHLPFTIAPLIKITSSERIMGPNRSPFYLETLAWLSLGILTAVNVTLVFDLVFGESEDGLSLGGLEYLPGFEWLMEKWGENFHSAIFGAISVGTSLSLGFLVWLIFTPLQLDGQNETQFPSRSFWIEEYARQEEVDLAQLTPETRPTVPETYVDSLPLGISVDTFEDDVILDGDLSSVDSPDHARDILHSETSEGADEDSEPGPIKIERAPQLPEINSCEGLLLPSPAFSPGSSMVRSPLASSPAESTTSSSSLRKPLTVEKTPTAEDGEVIALKNAEAEADADTELLGKDDDEMDVWGNSEQDEVAPDAVSVNVNGSSTSLQFEGPESGRSDGGSGSGSLSRLSGLGRAARRQFALILDDFWACLFDLHGQPLPPRSQGLLSGSKGHHVDRNLRGNSNFHDGSDNLKSQSKQTKSSWKKPNITSEQANNLEAYVLRAHTHAATSAHLSQTLVQSQDYGVSPSYVSERRYSSMRTPSYHEEYDYQPATIHGYRTPSFPGRTGSVAAKGRPLHLDMPLFGSRTSPHDQRVDLDSSLLPEYRNVFDFTGQPVLNSQWGSSKVGGSRSLIDPKGGDRLLTETEKHLGASETSNYDSCQWDPLVYKSSSSTLGSWNPLVYRATGELDMKHKFGNAEDPSNSRISFGHSPIGRGGQGVLVERAPLVFDELSPSQSHRDGFSIQSPTPGRETQSLWSRQPFEQLFGATDAEGVNAQSLRQKKTGSRLVQSPLSSNSLSDGVEVELEVLGTLQICVRKLLRLDGADWLFRVDNGADEDLVAAIAALQTKFMEAEVNDGYRLYGSHEHNPGETHSQAHGWRGSTDLRPLQRPQNGVHSCGKGCVWDGSLLVSFGVWCVHRVLELSLMESRPELWGKYTYVLNRLQGILEPAFSKPRTIPMLCSCVNDPILLDVGRRRTSSSRQGGLRDYGSADFGSSAFQSYPHPWPWGRNTSCAKGRATSASTFLDMIKEVETAVASRKGRTGTAAGDVAFPKGKENLASVLKRYKRRLSSKPSGSTGVGNVSRRV